MQWNPKDKEMFEGKGHGDVHTHLDNVLREGQASFPPSRPAGPHKRAMVDFKEILYTML